MTNGSVKNRKLFGAIRTRSEWIIAYAIMETDNINAVAIGKKTGIGYGYVMEILKLFEANELLNSVIVGRVRVYGLTPLGRAVFKDIHDLEKSFVELDV